MKFCVSVSTVIVITRLSGNNLGSIYIQKGNLKQGLIIGSVAFLIAAIGAPFIAPVLFQARESDICQDRWMAPLDINLCLCQCIS